MLNRTHAEHAIIAVVVQVAIFAAHSAVTLSLSPMGALLGGTASVCVFLGREVAQHEYKGGGPNNVSPLYGLTHHWSADSVIDVLAPLLSCAALYAAAWWLL